MVQIKLPDGSVKEFPEGVRPREVAEGIGKRLAQAAVAAKVDGTVVDLDRQLEDGTGDAVELRLLTPGTARPSTSCGTRRRHIMARAVLRLFPGARLAFGPTIETGFYYDIDSPTPIPEEDFPRIEAEMTKIVEEAEPFERFELPVAEARQFVDDLGQGFKVEHIDDELKQVRVLSFYRQGEFIDLCRGPHIPHAGKIGAFKLLSHRRGLLEERRRAASSSSGSTAPRSSTRRSSTPTSPRSRRRRSATTACSASSSSCSPSASWSAGPDPVDAEGGDRPRHPGDLHQGRAAQARLPAGLHPAHRPAGAVPHQRPLPVLPRRPVPADLHASLEPTWRRRWSAAWRSGDARRRRRRRSCWPRPRIDADEGRASPAADASDYGADRPGGSAASRQLAA